MYKCHRFPKLFPCTKYSLDLTLVKSFSRLASIVIEGGREGGREENGRARDVFRARVGRMIISVSIAAIFLYVRGGQKMSTNDGRGKAAERSHVPSSPLASSITTQRTHTTRSTDRSSSACIDTDRNAPLFYHLCG